MFNDSKDWIKPDRITSPVLEETLFLEPGEEVLTWADFTCGFSSQGTLFLSNRRFAWMKWKQPIIRWGENSLQIRLADIRSCQLVRAWWMFLREGFKVKQDDGRSHSFIPVHSRLDIRSWNRAVNDLAQVAG